MKVYIKNQQRLIKINHQRIKRHLRKVLQLLELHKAELSILFVNARRMKALNMKYRGVNKATDVLSFPIYTCLKESLKDNSFLLGDIVINLPKAQRQAADHGFTLNEELGWLLIHGLLHLLGYGHEKSRYQKNKMESKERELLYAITQKSIDNTRGLINN